MTNKVIIAGGRHYQMTESDFAWLSSLHKEHTFTHLICGMCSGADKGGFRWANANGLDVVPMPARWHDLSHPKTVRRVRPDGTVYNAAAGPIRNEEMAKIAQSCILFPGGDGTAGMRQLAIQYGIRLFEKC